MIRNTLKIYHKAIVLSLLILFFTKQVQSQTKGQLRLSNPENTLSILVDCTKGCRIGEILIQNKNVLSQMGVQTSVQLIDGHSYSSAQLIAKPKFINIPNGTRITDIKYGNQNLQVSETWDFINAGSSIIWEITREYLNNTTLKDSYMPEWAFSENANWKGGILDNGGMVWWKYLKNNNDTYGVHTAGATFWNSETGAALRITPRVNSQSKFLAAKFSRKDENTLSFAQIISDNELKQKSWSK